LSSVNLYHSPAIAAEDDSPAIHADPRETFGRPGSRAPHLWIEQAGKLVSTLDLFGNGFVLVAAPGGAEWITAARTAVKNFAGLDFAAWQVGSDLHDPDNKFAAAYGLTNSGAALVRPDGFVAWRAKSLISDPEETLGRILSSVLARS
jgi:putative polyketide hydroxylase